jgi:hypothetical protein
VVLPAALLGREAVLVLALLVAALGWAAVREVLKDRPAEDPRLDRGR